MAVLRYSEGTEEAVDTGLRQALVIPLIDDATRLKGCPRYLNKGGNAKDAIHKRMCR